MSFKAVNFLLGVPYSLNIKLPSYLTINHSISINHVFKGMKISVPQTQYFSIKFFKIVLLIPSLLLLFFLTLTTLPQVAFFWYWILILSHCWSWIWSWKNPPWKRLTLRDGLGIFIKKCLLNFHLQEYPDNAYSTQGNLRHRIKRTILIARLTV